jgi:hypothetical protein
MWRVRGWKRRGLGIVVLAGVVVSVMWLTFSRQDVEEVIASIAAPDKTFRLIITKTKEYCPYGISGKMYISDWQGTRKRLVVEYFTDDLLELRHYLTWDEANAAFVYAGKWGNPIVINLKHHPL